MGGAGLHVTTTLTKLEELVSPSPAPPVRHAEEESEPEEEQVSSQLFHNMSIVYEVHILTIYMK